MCQIACVPVNLGMFNTRTRSSGKWNETTHLPTFEQTTKGLAGLYEYN